MRKFATRKRDQRGFTLVEMAIVLVIIGLLLGGVLKGQELIKNAKVKNYKSTVDAISAAMNTYLDRYKMLPGDDNKASSRFDGLTAANNGDGDGLITGTWYSNDINDESTKFFIHLAAAGLITGNPNGTTGAEVKPKGPNGASIGVAYHFWNLSGLGVCFERVGGEYAELVDLTFDDGRPGTGNWQASGDVSFNSYKAMHSDYKSRMYTLCSRL